LRITFKDEFESSCHRLTSDRLTAKYSSPTIGIDVIGIDVKAAMIMSVIFWFKTSPG
jgi:hypothetical protein